PGAKHLDEGAAPIRDLVGVSDRIGTTMQGPERFAPRGLLVRSGRAFARPLRVDAHEGVEGGIHLVNALEVEVEELARRDFLLRYGCCHLPRGRPNGDVMGHYCSSLLRSSSRRRDSSPPRCDRAHELDP